MTTKYFAPDGTFEVASERVLAEYADDQGGVGLIKCRRRPFDKLSEMINVCGFELIFRGLRIGGAPQMCRWQHRKNRQDEQDAAAHRD